MNYSSFTLDHLLKRVEIIREMKPKLTKVGLNLSNAELYAIQAELTERQPEGDFVTLLDGDGLPVGFEPIEYGKVELAQDEFDQVDEWADKGLSVSTFLGQY